MSIVFPAYNEMSRIQNALDQSAEFFKHWSTLNFEIIVVENGSTDNTYHYALELALNIARQPINNVSIRVERSSKGKGSALRLGMELAKGEYILLTDVDLSTPINNVMQLITGTTSGADLVIGSRNMKESVVIGRSANRRLFGNVFGTLARVLTPGITDTQCGFKLLTNKACKAIFPLMTLDGFAFDVELLFIARKLGYYILEVPVLWTHNPESKVNVIPDSLKMARDLVKIISNNALGRYRV